MIFGLLLALSLVAGAETGQRSPSAESAAPAPRYAAPKAPLHAGPAASRLFESQEYVRNNPAPDYWALAPYSLPQQEGTCAASSLAMVLNALNAHRKATATDKLVTTKDLIEQVNDPAWAKSMQDKKCYGLDQLAEVLKVALRKFGHEKTEVKIVHVSDATTATAAALRQELTANEKSDRDFIIANFLQGQFTGDPDGTGHVSPVGAYDAQKHRVLVLDVDREYYEPYWVTEEIFLAGMNTSDDGAKKFRGYLLIREP